MNRIAHPTVDERRARGKAARAQTPLKSHNSWTPAVDRPDPIALLEAQNRSREPDLVPVRHGRMLVSPFTFYRGAAKIMAGDLNETPNAGLTVQLCGDAHLSNFGVFASPERTLVFDLNDFDETLPGPFEYDVKRMAASFTIAARNNGFTKSDARVATTASVRAYRDAMANFADADTMDIWYAHISADDLLQAMRRAAPELKGSERKRLEKQAEKAAEKAHTRDSLQALSKLAEYVDGQYRIVSQPPIIVPAQHDVEAAFGISREEVLHTVHEQFRGVPGNAGRRPAPPVGAIRGRRHRPQGRRGRQRRHPGVHRAAARRATNKTRCSYKSKKPPAPFSRTTSRRAATTSPVNASCRGQRMMQAASDIFLGWTKGVEVDRYLYWRQLRT